MKTPVKVGGYEVADGGNGLYFLVAERGDIRATFFRDGPGVWRGTKPRDPRSSCPAGDLKDRAVEREIPDDTPDAHLVMAEFLVEIGP